MDDTGPDIDILAALTRLERADADLHNRLRARLGLGTRDLAAVQYIDRTNGAGHPAYARDLTPILGVSTAATSIVLDRLAKGGHVVSTQDPDNRRLRRLALSASTTSALAELSGETRRRLSELSDSLSRADRTRALRVIESITAALIAGAPDDDGIGVDRTGRGSSGR